MDSSSKITLKSQTGRGSKYSLQKLNLIYQIGLKLALIKGFDDKFRIRNKKGEFIPNSNLLDLIHNSMTVSKNLAGMEEFIDLLAEANAEPEWFVNHFVKSSLRNKLASREPREPFLEPQPEPMSPTPSETPTIVNPITTGAYWGPDKVVEKRNRGLATYRKPPRLPPLPPLKRAPISYTPPSSPPSPLRKERPTLVPASEINRNQREDDDGPPTLERMDVPPASPPREMPRLKRQRLVDYNDSDEEGNPKKRKLDDFQNRINKSMQWDVPDDDFD